MIDWKHNSVMSERDKQIMIGALAIEIRDLKDHLKFLRVKAKEFGDKMRAGTDLLVRFDRSLDGGIETPSIEMGIKAMPTAAEILDLTTELIAVRDELAEKEARFKSLLA